MSLLRLTLVAVLSLAAIALPLIGLFKAPWYILLLVLAAGYAITQFAIAPPETVIQSGPTGTSTARSTAPSIESLPDRPQSPSDQASQLTYRGANYQAVALASETEESGSETLSGKYRGCEWNHPIASSNEPMTEAIPDDRSVPVRMYRGVKISQG
jgi:hypothetical protein